MLRVSYLMLCLLFLHLLHLAWHPWQTVNEDDGDDANKDVNDVNSKAFPLIGANRIDEGNRAVKCIHPPRSSSLTDPLDRPPRPKLFTSTSYTMPQYNAQSVFNALRAVSGLIDVSYREPLVRAFSSFAEVSFPFMTHEQRRDFVLEPRQIAFGNSRIQLSNHRLVRRSAPKPHHALYLTFLFGREPVCSNARLLAAFRQYHPGIPLPEAVFEVGLWIVRRNAQIDAEHLAVQEAQRRAELAEFERARDEAAAQEQQARDDEATRQQQARDEAAAREEEEARQQA